MYPRIFHFVSQSFYVPCLVLADIIHEKSIELKKTPTVMIVACRPGIIKSMPNGAEAER